MIVVVAATLLLALVVSWVRSYFAIDAIMYNSGTLRKPGEDADDPTMWTYASRTIELSHQRGALTLGITRYRSLGATERDMVGWTSRARWAAESTPVGARQSLSSALFRFVSITDWSFLGLEVSTVRVLGNPATYIDVPHWMAVTVSAGLLARSVIPWRSERRRRRGLCPACGYDLKGALDQGCPECGTGRKAE